MGYALFTEAQHVPWWPWKMGRVYKARQDLCSQGFTIFWSIFGSYRKQQNSHHYHYRIRSTTALSPAALGVRCIFQSCCTPRPVSTDDEPHPTGKQLLLCCFGITQLLRLEVTSGDRPAHTLLIPGLGKPGCSGLCPVGFWMYPGTGTPHFWA